MNVDPLTLRPSYCTALNRRRRWIFSGTLSAGVEPTHTVYITIDGIIIDVTMAPGLAPKPAGASKSRSGRRANFSLRPSPPPFLTSKSPWIDFHAPLLSN